MADTLQFVEAQIQGRIADFLSLKKTLLVMQANSDANISTEAQTLLVNQEFIESKLTENLTIINNLKQSGDWSMSDIADLTLFYTSLERQISDVHNLQDRAGYKGAGIWDFSPWLIIAGAAIIIAIMVGKK